MANRSQTLRSLETRQRAILADLRTLRDQIANAHPADTGADDLMSAMGAAVEHASIAVECVTDAATTCADVCTLDSGRDPRVDAQYATYCKRAIQFALEGTLKVHVDVLAGEACAYRDLAGEPINARLAADERFQAAMRDAKAGREPNASQFVVGSVEVEAVNDMVSIADSRPTRMRRMTPAQARELGAALVECADFIDRAAMTPADVAHETLLRR